jgi:hypothetical protein
MAFTVPTQTRYMDDTTSRLWASVSSDVADDVTSSTPVWALLQGRMIKETGGEKISETVRTQHAPSATTMVAIGPGSDLPQGNFTSRMVAEWNIKYTSTPIHRNIITDDIQERGKDLIIKTLTDKMQVIRDTCKEKFETKLFDTIDTGETTLEPIGLNTIIPLTASRSTGTFGGIARPATYSSSSNNVVSYPATGNTFWGPVYLAEALGDASFGLKDHLTSLHNGIMKNREGYKPQAIVMPQNYFEMYEGFAESKTTIVKDATTRLADLGFEVLRFKGIPVVWSSSITANSILMLNIDALDVHYDPSFWFTMGDWNAVSALSLERIAQIFHAYTITSKYLSKFGRLTYA